ncbi:PrgH/EprH family type III secretion apparatus protein [Erwinia psidii]|uniref:PrgH/EprH family type III secretion apparatus protein n=1 Tax=Erwinia psidii TaxID=69224 RepID=A0A3N6S0C6_9GAMM|nr:PrgH/EprH family type III secretion apparatus protein [Erwinia psidii]MCX8958721.1 PrgH/EprH family type III secretion apparatus protein [Erwinia psidii]MCX8961149.1 PrgH/EprH family type III secretion apparatus protein [Erwinia psidii]MCX8966679.1 PrgH/EprH family type III secretion apparatus protein [Erwinia psidii]RQM38944.1 PrgH/EprH family type III secretion apparatus protein [Erwinia psidii]
MNNEPEEESVIVSPEGQQQNYALKILFGPMLGCELHLPADDYFLIIDPGLALKDTAHTVSSAQQHAAYYAQSTLYIPCNVSSPNIALNLSQPAESEENKKGFRLELQDSAGSCVSFIEENKIFTYEHINLALKRQEDTWSDDILNFNFRSTRTTDELNYSLPQKVNPNRGKKLLAGTCCFMILIILATVIWFKKNEYKQQVLTLSEVLSGAPAPLEIVKSRDNKILFVLAKNLPEMEWAKQALYRTNETTVVIPVWLKQQSQDIIRRLLQAGYPVLQIDYSSPRHPVIAVYRKLSADEERNLIDELMKNIKFAVDISIIIKSKDQLLVEARQGLDRFHVQYRQINTADGYGLIVRDALNDSVLLSLHGFISEFHHKWGSNIINFSINLDENWLQNKSYIDSTEGYLFLSPRHWYFPLNNTR